jgi:hypothetical protein
MFDGIPDPEKALSPEQEVWVVAAVIGLVPIVFLGLFLATPKAVDGFIADSALTVRSIGGKTSFALAALDTANAQAFSFAAEPGFKPWAKIRGNNGFGFKSGRFTLTNNREVELYLANETGAVLIPRENGLPLMIGSNDPERLLTDLRGTPQIPGAGSPKSPRP